MSKNETYRRYLKKALPYFLAIGLGIIIGTFFFGDTNDTIMDSSEAIAEVPYSCAMHPEIRSAEKGDCPICGMELVRGNKKFISADDHHFRMEENALALANIQTTTVGKSNKAELKLTLSGTITTNKKTDAIQTTLFSGRLDEFSVNFVGRYVRKGERIGTIYSPELYASQDKLLTSASYRDSHEKLFSAARNTLGLYKMTDEQIETLLETKKPIMNFPVIAEFSGTVTEILATEGDYYNEGASLYKISRLGTVWAVLDAYENQLSLLKKGQKIRVSASALEGYSQEGIIDFIEPILDNSNRTVAIRVSLDNKKGLLKPGMFIEGEVSVPGADGVITIPKSAVLWTGKRSLVYLRSVVGEPVFELREIALGKVIEDGYVVLDGLEAGDEVVVNGTFMIDAAAQLSGKRSMMNTTDIGILPMKGREPITELKKDITGLHSTLIPAYIALKNAMVAGNSTKINHSAKNFREQLAEVASEDLGDTDGGNLKVLSQEIIKLEVEKDTEKQRLLFKTFSELLMNLVINSKGGEQTIYVQYCPMADNNRGAYWLSYNETIRNPYFGDKMLRCGSNVRTIP